jgi:hypothetical protein
MAQTKRLTKDITHLDISVKRFKEMAKAQKRKNKIKGYDLDFKTFQFLEISILIWW